MKNSKQINFIQMSNLSKKQALAKIKKSLLALGLKYKPKEPTKKHKSRIINTQSRLLKN